MELIKELEQFNNFAEVRDHLSSFNISCKVDPNNENLYLITYDREKSDFTLPFMKQCRGTILECGTNKIVCYTFDKGLDFEFSNYDLNDKELQFKSSCGAKDIVLDWSSCHVEESIDGTQIRLFYYDGKWCKATTRCSDAYRAYWYSDKSFGTLFDEAAELCGFDYETLDKECCYSFVLCHPENRIVVEYEKPYLVHVLTRRLDTFEEVTDSHTVVGAQRPKVYTKFSTPWELVNYAHIQSNYNLEGYMVKCVDNVDGVVRHNRMKIITAAYFAVKELRGNGNNIFFRYLELRQARLLPSFIQYFPEFSDQFKAYETNILNIAREIKTQYINKFVYRSIKAADWHYRPLVYKLHGEYLKTHEKTTMDKVLRHLSELHPKQLCFLYNRTMHPEWFTQDIEEGDVDTVDAVDAVDTVDAVDAVGVVDAVDTVGVVDTVGAVGVVYTVDDEPEVDDDFIEVKEDEVAEAKASEEVST